MRNIGKILAGGAAAILSTALSVAAMSVHAQDVKSKKGEEIKLIGTPERCINPRNISSSHVIDNETIEFHMYGRKFYRSNLGRACPGLSRGDPIKYTIRGSQLCGVDTFTILRTTAGRIEQRATCGFGQFQEIEKVKIKKDE